MVHAEIISNLKKSCLAFGLTQKDTPKPLILAGSGFMIREDGFFVSAAHVSKFIFEMAEKYKAKGVSVDVRIFLNQPKENHSELVAIKVGLGYECPSINLTNDNETISISPDLYVGRVLGNEKFSFLKFDKPTKIKVFDSVLICGYPMVNQSIVLHSKDSNRWSPILQPGIVSSLLPIDESQNPYGIQTDIVGTGGSSGSPIISTDTGIVLGIAQKVLTAELSIKYHTAKIGLIYGISNFFVADAINTFIEKIKTEIDENANPKKNLIPNEETTLTTENVHLSNVYKNKKL